MRRGKVQIAVIAVACIALSAPAEARPRIFRVIGAIAAGSVAAIAGATYARARHHRDRGPSVSRRAATDIQLDRRGVATGWAGPLFWPNASSDLFDYVFGQSGGADRFWSYGYDEVLNGMFVTAGVPNERLFRTRGAAQLADNGSGAAQKTAPIWQGMCGQPPSQVNALVERIRTKLQPTPDQSAALDGLRDSLLQANARIEAACPTAPVTEATDRMDLMVSRLLAMRQAATTVLSPLRKFYATLDDNQKSLFNAVDADETHAVNAPINVSGPPITCADIAGGTNWPAARIARRVAPKGDQIEGLEMLRQVSASFGKFVATSCNADKAKSPPERLEAARNRVSVMRYAAIHVSPALDHVYGSLSARQKARFSSLGR